MELKQILEEEIGQKLTLKEASEIANTLVGYFDTLAKIYHRTENQNYDNDTKTRRDI